MTLVFSIVTDAFIGCIHFHIENNIDFSKLPIAWLLFDCCSTSRWKTHTGSTLIILVKYHTFVFISYLCSPQWRLLCRHAVMCISCVIYKVPDRRSRIVFNLQVGLSLRLWVLRLFYALPSTLRRNCMCQFRTLRNIITREFRHITNDDLTRKP